MSRPITAALLLALYLLHQDFWFWRSARPLILGVFPVGLFYHVVYTLMLSVALGWLVRMWLPASDVSGDDR